MGDNNVTLQQALSDRPTPPELSGQVWPSFLSFPLIWTSKPTLKSVWGGENQPGQKVTQCYPAVCVTHERNQRLQAIIRPFLPGAIWNEATEVARRGGHTLPTETRQASILRLDIANFTQLMDSHSLEQVLADLNAYFDALTQLVYRYLGDVHKYLGDGFLAIFTEADDAVQAGCALQQTAANFNQQQSARDGLVFPIRIAIDSGQIVMTSLGSPDRQDWTAMGMPVNLAERLQAQARPGRVWLSQATFDRLPNPTACRCLGPIKVKGRQEPVIVYEKL